VLLLLPPSQKQRRLLLMQVLCLLLFGTEPHMGLAAAWWHLLLGVGLMHAHTAAATTRQQWITCTTVCF
jgi:hypothetical protein